MRVILLAVFCSLLPFAALAQQSDQCKSVKPVTFQLREASGNFNEIQAFRAGKMGDWSFVGRSAGGLEWLVAKSPALDQSAIAVANVVPIELGVLGDTTHVIQVVLTPAGTEVFSRLTRDRLNKEVAFLIDGVFLSGVTIRAHLTKGQFQIDIPNTPVSKLNEIACGFTAR